MRNEKGMVIFLAIVFSSLLLLGGAAVYSLISGRFSITRHVIRKVQAMRDAESASFVTHQMLMQESWRTNTADKTVRLRMPDGVATRTTVNIDLNDDEVSGYQPIRAMARY